jgi:hypothetical protein
MILFNGKGSPRLGTSNQYDQDEIRAFLLGQLSEKNADEFESRLFVDDDLLRSVDECEHVLADQFVDRELSPDDLPRFQELYRFSSRLQGLVAERRILDAALKARREARQQVRRRWFGRIGFLAPFALVAACALLAVLVLRRPIRRTGDASSVVPRSKSDAAPTAVSPAASVPVFFLADIVTRGAASPPVLTIAPDTTQIELEIEVGERTAMNPDWSAELSSGGHAYLTLNGLHPQRIGAFWVLKFPLSVAELPGRQYNLRCVPLNSTASPFHRSFWLKRPTQKAGR